MPAWRMYDSSCRLHVQQLNKMYERANATASSRATSQVLPPLRNVSAVVLEHLCEAPWINAASLPRENCARGLARPGYCWSSRMQSIIPCLSSCSRFLINISKKRVDDVGMRAGMDGRSSQAESMVIMQRRISRRVTNRLRSAAHSIILSSCLMNHEPVK